MVDVYKKVWGSEEWLVNTDKYCGKILNLDKACKCSDHYHKIKDETFLVIKGAVFLHLRYTNEDDQIVAFDKMVLRPYESWRVQPYVIHSFTGLENSKIVEFSTHHEDSDSYRLDTSRRLSNKEFNNLLLRLGRECV